MKSILTKKNNASLALAKKKKTLVMLGLVIAFSINTKAQTCGSFYDPIKAGWETLYTVAHPVGEDALTLIPVVGQNNEAVEAISEASVNFHDFIFNQNNQSFLTLGNRALPVLRTKTRQHGTLRKVVVGGVRVFSTSGMLWDKVELTIEKTDGRAETEIIICTWDMETNAKNNYTEYTFPSGNTTSTKKFTIKNVHGKSIIVKLKNRSATNNFMYTITSQGFLNLKKQKARAYKHLGITKIQPVQDRTRGN